MGLKYYLKRSKHYIKQIMPYRLVLKYEEKRDFFAQYFAWKEMNPQVEFDTESKFETIVSVAGFGYSGSGAIIDLLREYDDCLVHGMAEGGSKATPAADDLGEISVIKNPGGLQELDSVIDAHSNYFIQDEAIKHFGKSIARDPLYFAGFKYRDYIFHFFDSMIEDVIPNTKGTLSLIMPRLRDNIFTLHNFSKQEYYQLCQRFLHSIFNLQYDGKHKYLVLDQLVTAVEAEEEYCRNYLPNMKNIVVWRDPRDIYVIAKHLDLQWLEHDTPEHFIRRMKRIYANLFKYPDSRLLIRFEDLVLDYDNTVAKIEKYLKLGEHKRPQSCLDISISSKHVGTWKTVDDITAEDFVKIETELSEYCYKV